MFQSINKEERFDLIVFGAPFFPELPDAEIPITDRGGVRGDELAVRFASEAPRFLNAGGCAITYMADFVDSLKLVQTAARAGLHCQREEKFVLYPFLPRYGFPVCHEIKYREQIERACQYFFHEEIVDGRRFLRFKMVFFMFSKPS
jgi:hypothetical protein